MRSNFIWAPIPNYLSISLGVEALTIIFRRKISYSLRYMIRWVKENPKSKRGEPLQCLEGRIFI